MGTICPIIMQTIWLKSCPPNLTCIMLSNKNSIISQMSLAVYSPNSIILQMSLAVFHKTQTTLFSISLHKFRRLQLFSLESTNYDYESAEYRVIAIILDTTKYRLFRPACSDLLSTNAKARFIKPDFINKGIDVVNLPSIIRSKSVTEIL